MRISYTFLILILISSCVEVGFKLPMPPKGKALSSVPLEIIKFYSELDSISRDSNKLTIDDFLDGKIDDKLPENSVLKYWRGNYFLNQQEDSLWNIIMISPSGRSSFEIYHLDGGNEKTLELLKNITSVEEITDDKGELELIIIDPTFKEFKKIIKSGAYEKVDIYN